MADLTIIAAFTQNNGDLPATGLALADILLYLTATHRATGARTVIWNGVQADFEIDNTGSYGKMYTLADLDVYNYVGGGQYVGAAVLDSDWAVGSCGIIEPPVGTAIDFTYTLTNSVSGLPIEGADIRISTAISGDNVVWVGTTDVFGIARDIYGLLPRLDAGTYYFWRSRSGYVFSDPDIEIVS